MIYIVLMWGDDVMLAKYWKQIGFVILIIAILFNITLKLINKTSLKTELLDSVQYVLDKDNKENTVSENAIEE